MFEKLRLNRAWRAELRELDQKKAPAHLAKPDDSSPGRLLWCLPVPGKPDVFMALEKGEHADHDRRTERRCSAQTLPVARHRPESSGWPWI